MQLDYGKRTVTIAPVRITPTATLTVKQQIATRTTTKPLATALKTTVSTPTATKAPALIVPKTATTVNTIFSKNIGTKTVVPLALSGAPISNALISTAAGIKTISTGTYLAVTPSYTTAQKEAIAQAQNLQLGSQLVSAKSNQKMIAFLRSASIVKNLQGQGLEIIPSSTISELKTDQEKAASFRDQLNALMGQQQQWSTAQAGYLQKIAGFQTELSKATAEGAVAKGQLTLLGSQYEDLWQRYQDLLNKPPEPGIDIFGGLTDALKKYGVYAIIGVLGLVALYVGIKAFKK